MVVLVLATVGLLGGASAVTAQSGAELDTIVSELADTGQYLEFSSNADLEGAIRDANARGIAFAWIDSDADAEAVAETLSARLGNGPYRTVLVLTNAFVGAWSSTVSTTEIQSSIDAAGDDFAAGAVADGVDRFTTSLAGQTTATTTSGGSTGSGTTSGGSSGGGIGLGTILLAALVGGGGFLLFRNARTKSKAKKEAAIDLEEDRAEIKEQLRDNADHVLNLGDRVIEADRPKLISTYEEASAAYQDVSQSIDAATTAEEVDRLDDKIDRAEWQFESIAAALDGRPAPPSPEDVEAQARPEAGKTPAPAQRDGRPALRADESVIAVPPAPAGRQPRYQQPVPRSPYPEQRRRRGGMGGMLGSILGSIVLGGGGLGGMTGSRRTQRRRTTRSGGSLGGTSMGGGLGGGVLRRGGSSKPRSRSGGGGSRSIGRRGGGGSRRL